MANLYTSLYGLAPNAGTPTYSYRGPQADRSGQSILRYSTYTGLIGTDTLYVAGGFLATEKVSRITIRQSGDGDTDNDFTFNLGWRVGTAATPGTAFLSASTGLQATTPVALTAADNLAVQAAAEGDDLLLVRAAGEIEASITLHFLVESFIP